MSIAEVKLDEKIKQEIVEPGKFKIIMLNDNLTPMD